MRKWLITVTRYYVSTVTRYYRQWICSQEPPRAHVSFAQATRRHGDEGVTEFPTISVKGSALCDQHALGLRAGDVLHLAVASEHGATMQTLDQRLAEAGPALGVSTKLLA